MDLQAFSEIITSQEIDEMLITLADRLDQDYRTLSTKRPLLIVGILKGAIFMLADLLPKLKISFQIEFIQCSSYGDLEQSSGNVNFSFQPILSKWHACIEDRDILIVDEIVDSGRTLSALQKYFLHHQAKSVALCALLDKPSGREVDLTPTYCGKTVPGGFLIGYGLDFKEQCRNMPSIYEKN